MDNEAVEELEQVEIIEEATDSNEEVVEETTNVEDESTTGEVQADETPPPVKKVGKGVQKRINKLTKEKFIAQEEVRELKLKLASSPAVAVIEPKVDDFETYEEYEKANLNTRVKQAVNEQMRANKEADTANVEESRRRDVIANYNANVESYAEEVEDFHDVVGNMPEMNDSVTEAVIESGKSAQLHYYLGNNPEVLTKLSNLSPMSVAREIGKLEVLLEKPPAIKKVTNAPDPIKPVGSNSSLPNDVPSDKDSIDDWMQKANKRANARRR